MTECPTDNYKLRRQRATYKHYDDSYLRGYHPLGSEIGAPGLAGNFRERVEVVRFFCASTLLRVLRISSSFSFLDIANSINSSPFNGRHCAGTWDKIESARSRLWASNNGRRQHVNSARPTRNKNGTPGWFTVVSTTMSVDV